MYPYTYYLIEACQFCGKLTVSGTIGDRGAPIAGHHKSSTTKYQYFPLVRGSCTTAQQRAVSIPEASTAFFAHREVTWWKVHGIRLWASSWAPHEHKASRDQGPVLPFFSLEPYYSRLFVPLLLLPIGSSARLSFHPSRLSSLIAPSKGLAPSSSR